MSGAGLVLITGASGFVGRATCQELAASGWSVRALVRSATELPGAAEVRAVGDLAGPVAWSDHLRGVSAVVHLAARVHLMDDRAADPIAAYRAVNVDLTRRVLEAAAAAGCGTFIFASSVKAVGERTTVPWTEDISPQPEDPYGRSKLEAERLVHSEGRRLGIRTIVLRFPLVYGPGMRANMLRLFDAVDRGLPLPLASVHNRRSLLFVGNAAVAVEQALARSEAGSGTYFVSDGQDLSTADLVRAVAGALGRRAQLVAVPPALFKLAGRVGDLLAPLLPVPVTTASVRRLLDSLQVDIGHARAAFGYAPRFTLAEGLAETAKWYRGRAGDDRT